MIGLRRGGVGSGLTLSGLWQRRWLSLVVFLTAAVAAMAAAIGPTYADSARTAIVRDAFSQARPEASGMMVSYQSRPTRPGDLADAVAATGIPEAFDKPIEGAEVASTVVGETDGVKLIWRDGACGRLSLTSGRCPAGPGEVVASAVTARRYGWTLGRQALLDELIPPRPLRAASPDTGSEAVHPFPLRVVGLYEPRDSGEAYWFGLPYFPDSTGQSERVSDGGRLFDPLFTESSTVKWARPANPSWEFNVTMFVDPKRLTGDDAKTLEEAVDRTREWAGGRVVSSGMKQTAARALRDLDALGVPVALVILELVALSWLVLFFAVGDLVEARRQEIGLGRLRGLSPAQMWRFGLGEPVSLLLVALPAGVLSAWPIARWLSDVLLDSDVPVSLDSSAWLAGVGAVAGGLVAAGLGARGTMTATVTEQWRRSRSHPGGRSWVPDAIVLGVVAAGLVELTAQSTVTNLSRQNTIGLLVPALMAVGVALVAARALPHASRVVSEISRRRGGIASFVAFRRLARAPGATSAVIVLAASFALATFAVSVWSVTADNHREVARAHNGAATVLDVRPPEGSDLPRLVERADPDGRSAAVAIYERGVRLLAVDTKRFGDVANWRPGFAARPLSELLPDLRPRQAARIAISGDRIRVTTDSRLVPDPILISVDVELPDRQGLVQFPLSEPGFSKSDVLVGRLSQSCHRSCELRGLSVQSSSTEPAQAELVVRKIEVRSGGEWHTIDAGLSGDSGWRAESLSQTASPTTSGTSEGLSLRFVTGNDARVVVATHPAALPAITVGRIAPRPGGARVVGLDGVEQQVSSIAEASGAPGATRPTAVVEFALAERAAFGLSRNVRYEVWVGPGATAGLKQALRDQGVTVTGQRTVDDLVRQFNRQGPGLAMVLLLASTAAAAVLALARATLGLYASGRRRRYELAALGAIGVSRRTQRGALLLEQGVVLGVGAAAGVAAGIAAGVIALRRIPQFTFEPTTPPLSYTPDPLVYLGVAVAAALGVAIAAVLTTEAIRRSVGIEQLRELPP